MSKKNLSIPASIGAANLVETFNKLSLSPEVKDFLASLQAELSVRFIPGSNSPILEIVARNGKAVCSIEEFVKLTGYRRWINDILKDLDKEQSSSEKIKLIGFFRRIYKPDTDLPDRILEPNLTRFNQLGNLLKTIEKHEEVIETTIDNDYKTYIVEKLTRLKGVILTVMKNCMGPEKVEQASFEDLLFEAGVPKWLHNKFSDKNFTNNLKTDCVTLLFPRNNYLKSIALTTLELSDEQFITANETVMINSGGVKTLAQAGKEFLFPEFSPLIQEEINAFLRKYMWILTNPYTSDEILAVRESGKAPPIFREAQRPQIRPGDKKSRPETETQRICREIGNALGLLQATWQNIMNFVIPTANPLSEFWGMIYANHTNWEISPTNNLYNCIRSEGNLTPLNNIRSFSGNNLTELIANIIAARIRVPSGTNNFIALRSILLSIRNSNGFVEVEAYNFDFDAAHTVNLDILTDHPVTEEQENKARTFLGVRTRASRKKKRSGASAVRLHSSVTNELKALDPLPDLQEKVKDWLMQSFKTGRRTDMQLLAAERVVGEALKHQGELFDDYEEDDILLEIEEYYEDEN